MESGVGGLSSNRLLEKSQEQGDALQPLLRDMHRLNDEPKKVPSRCEASSIVDFSSITTRLGYLHHQVMVVWTIKVDCRSIGVNGQVGTWWSSFISAIFNILTPSVIIFILRNSQILMTRSRQSQNCIDVTNGSHIRPISLWKFLRLSHAETHLLRGKLISPFG